ncbi:MAG: hypothetical protein SFT91_03445 [Rickettsiaceae bacterium]|nr:hypothetical protein [Rickettsiaceae bacterium]
MKYKQISFDQFLSYQKIALAMPYPEGHSLNYLEKIADFESLSMLRKKDFFCDYEGLSLLRHQLEENFYKNSNGQIFLRTNIPDFIDLISSLEEMMEIKLPDIIDNLEIIYDVINQTKTHKNVYIIDYWGLDISKIHHQNIIIFSSIEILYGIEGVNICWTHIRNEVTADKIRSALSHKGPACSVIAEVYGLIAARNHNLIRAQNEKLISENRQILELFKNSHHKVDLKISQTLPVGILKIEKMTEFVYYLKSHKSIFAHVAEGSANSMYIFFGKKEFKTVFAEFANAIELYI